MRYVLIGAVFLWIAYDVGSGALTGLAKARSEQLSAMPLAEMLDHIAHSEQRRIGSEWVDYVEVAAITAERRRITYGLTMTRKTKAQIDAKWSRGWRSSMRHELTEAACDSRLLTLALARGATVDYDAVDRNGEPVLRLEVGRADC